MALIPQWARRALSLGGRIAIALLLLWVIFSHVQIDQVAATVAHINPWLASASAVVMLLVGFIAATKWLILLRALAVPVTLRAVVRLSYIAVTWNLALPGGESGNLVKALLLARQSTGNAGKVWASTLIDQISLGVAQLLVALATLTLASHPPANLNIWLRLIAIFLVGVACFYALFLVPAIAKQIDRVIAPLSRALAVPQRLRPRPASPPAAIAPPVAVSLPAHRPGEWLAPLWTELTYYRGHIAALVAAIGLAMVYYGVMFGAYWLAARGLGIPFGYADIAWVTALAGIAGLAPITIAGVGVREGIITYYLHQHGIATAQALTFSLAVLALNLVLAVPGLIAQIVRSAPTPPTGIAKP